MQDQILEKNKEDESAIFNSIRNLRERIPNHSYLQYTATPQANLLIDTMSLLSPDWHVVLKPEVNILGEMNFLN